MILSRKGFDSDAGKCPNPIFDDGSMIALPIPDSTNRVRYADLKWRGRNLGEVVEKLNGSEASANSSAHLDPDLRPALVQRQCGWRPIFGQTGKAQGHLRNQKVGRGDLFVFFGLFRRVDSRLRWTGPRMHVLWGWMQIDQIVPVDVVRGDVTSTWGWAADHPHVAHKPNPDDTLYVATRQLAIPGSEALSLPGAGTFDVFNARVTARRTPSGGRSSRA